MTRKEIVAAAAKELDEREPGWEKLIDLDTLNMGNGCNCVLGQIGKAKRLRPKAGLRDYENTPYHRMLRKLGYGPHDEEPIPVACSGAISAGPWKTAIRARLLQKAAK